MKHFHRSPLPSRAVLLGVLCSAGASHSQVVNSEWNTGNGNWNVPASWSPTGSPDNGGGTTYNVRIGNRVAASNAQVTFVPQDGTSDTVTALNISAAADLFTNGNQLIVTGTTALEGPNGSSIRVDPHAVAGTTAFQTANLNVLNGGAVLMNGGILQAGVLLDLNAGSVFRGFGRVDVGDGDAVVEEALQHSTILQVLGTATTPGTLTLHANGVDTLDLDGNNEVGTLDVDNADADVELDTLTLVVDGPLADAFNGTLQVGQRDTVTFARDLSLSASAVTLAGGTQTATLNGAGAFTSIANCNFTVIGGVVIENDMAFSGTANVISLGNPSSLTLGGTVTLPDASALNFLTSTAQLIVTGNMQVSEAAGIFNWDGPGTATTTVAGTGVLTLAVQQVDTTDDNFGGTLNLNDNADVSVNVAGASWSVAGTINKNSVGTSTISGDPLVITGDLHANAGTLLLPATTLQSAASITADGVLSLGSGSTLAGPATVTGAGTLRMAGASTVTADTTIGVNTLDWDGAGSGSLHTISDGVIFTINSRILDTDGDMDDRITLGGNGAELVVSGPAEWTMNDILTTNAAAAGTASINGTSRLILADTFNVDGNTDVNAPITFGTGSTTSIDAAMTLDLGAFADYEGGTVGGAGTFLPAAANLVTASSTINGAIFDFDAGNWTIQNDATLTVNVTDYDTSAVNAFGSTITIISSDIDVTTSEAEFIMDGVLNLNGTVAGKINFWDGEPLDIGDDAGTRDADVNVTGPEDSQIGPQVDFNSDADVNIAAGGTLTLLSAANFDTVNGANSAEFTGAGTFAFSGPANFNEAATLNMVGGTVDLDGFDNGGDLINIDAPLIINAADVSSFGRTNGNGINTLDINNSVGTGVLTVNLDNPAGSWTLNAPGVMNLVNDSTTALLLAGSALTLNGTVNVTGDVRTDARLDIAGTVNILTAAQPFRLNGGSNADPNTLTGGTVNGPGPLLVQNSRRLSGFGTINAPVDSDATSTILADNGILNFNGAITGAGTIGIIGTADNDGILNIPAAWDSGLTGGVRLEGGELRGGAITVANSTGITGHGLVTAKVINNSRLHATTGILGVQTAGNDNDWDGTGAGQLRADAGDNLVIFDTAAFGFTGSVIATGGLVGTSGFALDFNPGSSINLTEGTYQSSNSTDIGGTVTVNAGADSTIAVANNRILTFELTSITTLTGNLRLVNNNVNIEPGATFSGAGALIIPAESLLVADPTVSIGVLLDNRGNFRPGGVAAIGRVDLQDYQQAATGELFVEITGTALNQFDRLVITGAAQLGGHLRLDIDPPLVPVIGQSFDIITATGVTGEFDTVIAEGMPAGLSLNVTYLANAVRVTVAPLSAYDVWLNARISDSPGLVLAPADLAKSADFDRDGLPNLGEFALDGHPFKGGIPHKIFGKVALVGGVNAFTLSIPVRSGAVPDAADPAGGPLVLKQTADQLTYSLQAGDTLGAWPLEVTEVTGADATAIQAGLPPVSTGWLYRTFRSPGPVAGDPREFMRVVITE